MTVSYTNEAGMDVTVDAVAGEGQSVTCVSTDDDAAGCSHLAAGSRFESRRSA